MPEEMEKHNRQLTQQWLRLLDGSLQIGATVELQVLSNSMLPVFGTGRYIKIQRVPWKYCSAGDIIVFREIRRLTTHRLLLVVRTCRRCYFYQKGDANTLGHFILAERVVGRVIEYQDETGSYCTLSSTKARRVGRVEAFKQLLRVVREYARRLTTGKTVN
jgi:signal peptidase I